MNIPFPEVFLHHVWKLKLFDFKDLLTTAGETIGLVSATATARDQQSTAQATAEVKPEITQQDQWQEQQFCLVGQPCYTVFA